MVKVSTPERDSMSPQQREVYDRILAGPRTSVAGPLLTWLSSPQLADAAQHFGAFCRFGTSLPPRLSELAIAVTASFWTAGYEWSVHAPIAAAAGISSASLEVLRLGGMPPFDNEDEKTVYDFARQLLKYHRVNDATGTQARKILGDQGVVELVGIVGYYSLVAFTINAFEIAPKEGSDPFSSRVPGPA